MTVGKPRDDAESDQEPPGVESTSGGEGTTFEPEEDPEGADPGGPTPGGSQGR